MALGLFNETRWSLWISRVLFLGAFIGCRSGVEEGKRDLKVLWEKERAVGITILHSDPELLTIKVKNSEIQSVLGEWIQDGDSLIFRALVPFSDDVIYELYQSNQLIDTFEVKYPASDPTEVVGIFPSTDTLPENLLKMYIQFSSPMVQGKAIQSITVLDLTNGDTLEGTFLNLQPELWNDDNTLLTLWLDPGRVKRGLIPNETLGAPLEAKTNYRIVVSNKWTDTNGVKLADDISKDFYTTPRDEISPDPKKWKIVIPKSGTKEVLSIEFLESLDMVLATEAIHLLNSNGEVISGSTILSERESVIEFNPKEAWVPGEYILQVESRLEDPAGNNLNRLFDMDISDDRKVEEGPEYVDLTIRIE